MGSISLSRYKGPLSDRGLDKAEGLYRQKGDETRALKGCIISGDATFP